MGVARFFLAQSLYANSLWLLLAQGVNYSLGFIFWLVVARLYPPSDVGFAAAVLPAASMVASLGMLGLGSSLIRFLSGSGQGAAALINQVSTAVFLVTALLTAIFVLGIETWSPELRILRTEPLYLIIFVALILLSAWQAILLQTFVASRRSGFSLAVSLIHGMGKTVGVLVLASLVGGLGIVLSWTLALALSVTLALFIFLPRTLPHYRLKPLIDLRMLSSIVPYSLANYVAESLWSVPSWVLPLVIVNRLGTEQNAYFGIAWVVAMLPLIIPRAVSMAMFAEGSHDLAQMRNNLLRSLRLCALMLAPLVLGVMLIGDKLLLLYGEGYAASGKILLSTTALAVLPGTVTILYVTIARVQKWLLQIVFLSAAEAIGVVSLTLLLVGELGVLAPGVALLTVNCLLAVALLPRMFHVIRNIPAETSPDAAVPTPSP